jgi:hypothetical protein
MIAYKMADLTRESQARVCGIDGDDGFEGMAKLQEDVLKSLLEAYHNLLSFHELQPKQKESKFGGP